jgi:hypothetical protein
VKPDVGGHPKLVFGVPVGGVVFLFFMVVLLTIGGLWTKRVPTQPDPPTQPDRSDDPDADPVPEAPSSPSDEPAPDGPLNPG